MEQIENNQMANELVKLGLDDLNSIAKRLVGAGRISRHLYIAFCVTSKAVWEAYMDPELHNVGDDIRMTIGRVGGDHV